MLTMRFMIGLGLVAILIIAIVFGLVRGLSYAKQRSLHRKRRWRRRGKKLRIDDLMLNPNEAEPGER